MAKKRKTVKKVRSREMTCDWNSEDMRKHRTTMMFAKLSSMTFILFLITVWPAAMNFVHSVHWGIWLTITVLFAVATMSVSKNCCKK